MVVNGGTVSQLTHLAFRVRPRAGEYAHGEKYDTENLQRAITLPSKEACNHSCHAAETAENDVHWDTDVVGKCPIIQHIDAEEHDCDERPSWRWHFCLAKCVWCSSFELRRVRAERGEDELQERDDQAYVARNEQCGSSSKSSFRHSPLLDSSLHEESVTLRYCLQSSSLPYFKIASSAKTLTQHPPKINAVVVKGPIMMRAAPVVGRGC